MATEYAIPDLDWVGAMPTAGIYSPATFRCSICLAWSAWNTNTSFTSPDETRDKPIAHVLKSGCRWCDCPPEYGPPTTIYNRFVRGDDALHFDDAVFRP